MKRDPNKIYTGDVVRVVNPLAFVRCGYPLDAAAVEKQMWETEVKRVSEFLDIAPNDPLFKYERNRIVGMVIKALTRKHLVANKFGGPERTVHTQEMPGIKGRLFTVESVRFKQSGIYSPASESYDPEYGSEFYPPDLCDRKTHKILNVRSTDGKFSFFEIEDCHVEKVTEASISRAA